VVSGRYRRRRRIPRRRWRAKFLEGAPAAGFKPVGRDGAGLGSV